MTPTEIRDAVTKGKLRIFFAPDLSSLWNECSRAISRDTGWENLLGSVKSLMPIIGASTSKIILQNTSVLQAAEEFNKEVRLMPLRAEFARLKG